MTEEPHGVEPGRRTRVASRKRWVIVGMLAVLAFINYGDRAAFGVASKPIMSDLGFSATTFGLISSVFTIGYVPGSLLGGYFGDRFGAARVLRFTVALWSVIIGLLALTTSYVGFLVNRFIFGIAEGPNFALDTKLVSRWVPPRHRGRALSGVTVGIPLGTAIAAPIVGILVATIGWQISFVALAVAGLVWLLVGWRLVKDGPDEATAAEDQATRAAVAAAPAPPAVSEETATATSLRSVLASGSVWAVILAAFCGAYFNFMLITWLPQYFSTSIGFSLASSATATAAPWAGAAVGIVISGLLSDRILRRTGNVRWARSGLLGMGLIGSAICLVTTTATHSVLANISLMTLAALLGYPAVTNLLYSIVTSLVPVALVSSATGLVVGLAALGGLLGPYITGALVDATGGFSAPLLVAAGVTVVGGLSAVFGVRTRSIPRTTSQNTEAPSR